MLSRSVGLIVKKPSLSILILSVTDLPAAGLPVEKIKAPGDSLSLKLLSATPDILAKIVLLPATTSLSSISLSSPLKAKVPITSSSLMFVVRAESPLVRFI